MEDSIRDEASYEISGGDLFSKFRISLEHHSDHKNAWLKFQSEILRRIAFEWLNCFGIDPTDRSGLQPRLAVIYIVKRLDMNGRLDRVLLIRFTGGTEREKRWNVAGKG